MAKKPSRKPSRSAEPDVLYGITPVESALRAERRALRRLWARRESPNPRVHEVLERAVTMGLEVVDADHNELARRAGSPQHQGLVLACGPLPLLHLSDVLQLPSPAPVVLAVDRVEDPQNLGGLVRTAAFLGAVAIVLHRSHRAPLSAVVSKASAGTLESFPVAEVGNLSDALLQFERDGWTVVGSALEEGAIDYREFAPRARTVLVMGNEGSGLRALTRKRCHQLVNVPRRGDAESLNVTVAAGVLLAHLVR